MSATGASAAISPEKALRKLFLRLFLRGRGARGLNKDKAPKSVASKLAATLVFYVLFGFFAAAFFRQGVFALSVYLHASTLMFIGMFVATSAGEALFNKEEADILMHRPVRPQALLWAKISVLAQISIWLAAAYNAVGFFVGAKVATSGLLFVAAHAASMVMEAMFCIALVVVTYQLCMRWFGRERLDAIVTTAQTLMTIVIVVGSQLAPRFLMRPGAGNSLKITMDAWWIALLPPAWFAGIDDAIAGNGTGRAWFLGAIGTVVTVTLMWVSFGKLARDYATGLQMLNETGPRRVKRPGQRSLIERALAVPPLRWWLRNSIERAAFVLTVAYLLRDRETKLRVYPGLAPMLVMPIIFLMPQAGVSNTALGKDFGVAFAGTYLGMLPMLGLTLLKYSQQWQAADIFRSTPVPGPAALCHGARKAVLVVLTLPLFTVLIVAICAMGVKVSNLSSLLAGIIALPVFAMIPCVRGEAVPLSMPAEEAKSAGRGLQMLGVTFAAMAIGAMSALADKFELLWWFLGVEAVIAVGMVALFRTLCARAPWPED